MFVDPFCECFLLYGISFVCYSQYGTIRRVQLQDAEGLILCPFRQTLPVHTESGQAAATRFPRYPLHVAVDLFAYTFVDGYVTICAYFQCLF